MSWRRCGAGRLAILRQSKDPQRQPISRVRRLGGRFRDLLSLFGILIGRRNRLIAVVHGIVDVVDVITITVSKWLSPSPWKPTRHRAPGGPTIWPIPSPTCVVRIVFPKVIARMVVTNLIANFIAALDSIVEPLVHVVDPTRAVVGKIFPAILPTIDTGTAIVHSTLGIVAAGSVFVRANSIGNIAAVGCSRTGSCSSLWRSILQKVRRCIPSGRTTISRPWRRGSIRRTGQIQEVLQLPL